jgi:tetratricopeptide (TPR) repeat protein
MARKLSRLTRHALLIIAIPGLALTARYALADGENKRAVQPQIVPNPFAAAPSKQISKKPQPRPQRGTTYRNPFAASSAAPPAAAPLLPGPISRWRPSAVQLNQSAAIKSAVLSDPLEHTRTGWDQLPPAEKLRDRGNPHGANGILGAQHLPTEPPDPIDFTTETLTQPVWLTTSAPSARPFSPIGQAAFEQPLGANSASSPPSSALTPSNSDLQPEPLFISDFDVSAQNLLRQAQEEAHSAETVDQLSAVAELCQRALNGGPAGEFDPSARRLAAWAHNRRGELLVEAGRQQEAINDFQLAISLDSECSLAIHNRAVTLAEQNNYEAALVDFNRVIELNPGLAVAYRNRAELFAAQGKMNEAVADYTRAIEGMANDAELYGARAHAYQSLGQFEPALADLNRSIHLATNSPDGHLQRGNLLAERGEFEQAIADFKKALACDPEMAEAHRSLAWLQATCPDDRYRDPKQALSAAQQAVELSPPDSFMALDALAAAHASAGHFDQAIKTQQQAISAAPPEFASPMKRRLALYQKGRPFQSAAATERTSDDN